MKRTKGDRLRDERVQQERMARGREKARKKRELALARHALQDRFEPCFYFAKFGVPRPHHWRLRSSDTEECIFCNKSRTALGAFGAAGVVGRNLTATEIRDRYREGNQNQWAKVVAAHQQRLIEKLYPTTPTKGAKG